MKAIFIFLIIIAGVFYSFSHSGKTDSKGGHTDRSTGKYHYHNKNNRKSISGKVVKVSDGDTITILSAGNRQVKIRFEGIDTPEKNQAFGTKAKSYLSRMVAGKMVKVSVKEKDRYGRTVGTVFVGSKNVNLEMVKAGLAWHYKFYSKDKTLAKAEELARKAKKGLWVDKNPTAPWDFRRNSRR